MVTEENGILIDKILFRKYLNLKILLKHQPKEFL